MEIQINDKEKNKFVREVAEQKYEYGFTTDVHTDIIPKDLTRMWYV
jgi:Fe-S cluster assembly protein SufB